MKRDTTKEFVLPKVIRWNGATKEYMLQRGADILHAGSYKECLYLKQFSEGLTFPFNRGVILGKTASHAMTYLNDKEGEGDILDCGGIAKQFVEEFKKAKKLNLQTTDDESVSQGAPRGGDKIKKSLLEGIDIDKRYLPFDSISDLLLKVKKIKEVQETTCKRFKEALRMRGIKFKSKIGYNNYGVLINIDLLSMDDIEFIKKQKNQDESFIQKVYDENGVVLFGGKKNREASPHA